MGQALCQPTEDQLRVTAWEDRISQHGAEMAETILHFRGCVETGFGEICQLPLQERYAYVFTNCLAHFWKKYFGPSSLQTFFQNAN